MPPLETKRSCHQDKPPPSPTFGLGKEKGRTPHKNRAAEQVFLLPTPNQRQTRDLLSHQQKLPFSFASHTPSQQRGRSFPLLSSSRTQREPCLLLNHHLTFPSPFSPSTDSNREATLTDWTTPPKTASYPSFGKEENQRAKERRWSLHYHRPFPSHFQRLSITPEQLHLPPHSSLSSPPSRSFVSAKNQEAAALFFLKKPKPFSLLPAIFPSFPVEAGRAFPFEKPETLSRFPSSAGHRSAVPSLSQPKPDLPSSPLLAATHYGEDEEMRRDARG